MGQGGVVLCPDTIFCEALKLVIQEQPGTPVPYPIGLGRVAQFMDVKDHGPQGTNWQSSSAWSDRGHPAYCAREATRPPNPSPFPPSPSPAPAIKQTLERLGDPSGQRTANPVGIGRPHPERAFSGA